MKVLVAPTEDFIKREHGRLDASAAPGSNVVLTLLSNEGLAIGNHIAIGHEGSETAELQRITAVTGSTQVTVATLKFYHGSEEPITYYRYNQRKFYGSVTVDGTFNHLAASGSPKDIQVDDPQGTILEYAGVDGYVYFKATYYNSQTLEETDIADAVATLADDSKRYTSIEAIKKQAGLSRNPYINDADVEVYRKRAENEVNSIIGSKYTLPLAEVPAIIENATALLAAGYMDYKEMQGDGEGVKWLGEARGLLKSIADGKQKLLASDGTELEGVGGGTTTSVLEVFPDDTISDKREFRMSDRY